MTALMWASKLHKYGVAKLLLELGADVNAVDGYGWTALMHAAQCEHMRIMSDLIAQGANINHTSKEGITALHVACQHDSMQMLSWLVKNGADANLLDAAGLLAFDYLSTASQDYHPIRSIDEPLGRIDSYNSRYSASRNVSSHTDNGSF